VKDEIQCEIAHFLTLDEGQTPARGVQGGGRANLADIIGQMHVYEYGSRTRRVGLQHFTLNLFRPVYEHHLLER
jgi:hypothetical protein